MTCEWNKVGIYKDNVLEVVDQRFSVEEVVRDGEEIPGGEKRLEEKMDSMSSSLFFTSKYMLAREIILLFLIHCFSSLTALNSLRRGYRLEQKGLIPLLSLFPQPSL